VIRVGPAGWSYDDWAGIVYPAPRPRGFRPLRFLAPFVDAIEVNSTFYAMPSAEDAARWAEEVADLPDFRFTAKVHQAFTHEPWTAERAEEARRFLEGVRPLAESGRLSALLLQFPVTFRRGEREVERLRRLRDLFGGHPLVLEVRHRTWFEPEGIAELAPLGMSLAHIDLPAAKDHPPEEHETLGPIGYLRLHGRNAATWFAKGAGRDQRYDYLYAPEEVGGVVERARRIAAKRAETFVVTNNHFAGKGMANTIEILAALRGGPVPTPAPLLAAFPRLRESGTPTGQLRWF
jgi:uncharacterized protein YecE (DUF72 family)